MIKKKFSKTIRSIFSQKGRVHSRSIYIVMIMTLVTLAALAISGGPQITQDPRYVKDISGSTTCCDTGNGDNCRPLYENQIAYNGEAYALLKSNVNQSLEHLEGTDQHISDGQRIFINKSGGILIKNKCSAIPTNQLIYVCVSAKNACEGNIPPLFFDVYFRTSDGSVPKSISSSCPKPQIVGQKVINTKKSTSKSTLQMETFNIEEESSLIRWIQACKPQ